MRADSAFYSRAVLHTAAKFNVRFSVTTGEDKKIRAAIEAIGKSAWAPIPYWLSTPEVSGADVAETNYTAFAGTKQAMAVRMIVRRVRPTTSGAPSDCSPVAHCTGPPPPPCAAPCAPSPDDS